MAPKEAPRFKVTQAPGFAAGLDFFEPNAEITWEIPDGWNSKLNGKHYAEHGPSLTFEPLNDAAKDLLASHKEKVLAKNKPKPDANDARIERLELLILQQQEEHRKTMETFAATLADALGKKK